MKPKSLGNRLADAVANYDLEVKTPEQRKAFKKLRKKWARHNKRKLT